MPPSRRPGGDLELPADELHVWVVALDDDVTGPAREGILAADEMERARRLRSEADRRRFVAGRTALRELIGAYTSTDPAEVRFTYGERGKPALDFPAGVFAGDASSLRFNFSHSAGLAVCALVRDVEIGIDIEQVREIPAALRLARRFFAPAEYAHLSSLPPAERAVAFLHYWTCKEAILKATGKGLNRPLSSFSIRLGGSGPVLDGLVDGGGDKEWSLHRLSLPDGYIGAIALQGPPRRLRIWAFMR